MKIKDLPASKIAATLPQHGLLLRSGPFALRMGSSLPELVEPIRLLYADYDLVEEEEIIDFDIRIAPSPRIWPFSKPKADFVIDGQKKFEPFDRSLALPMLEWGINWCSFTRPNHLFLLHSAVVERNGSAFILPGPPGSGKSTLCAAMVLRGWRLLSDELAMMCLGTTDLLPNPRPIGLKEESIGVIRHFDSNAVLGPICPGTKKGTVAHLRPPAQSIDRASQKASPRWIIFPAFKAGATPTLRSVSKGMTFLDLAEDSFNFSLLGAEAFETLGALIDQCDCYELEYGHLDDALRILAKFDESSPKPTGQGLVDHETC
jgi:hypothetical protein